MVCAKKSRLRINKKDTERKLRERQLLLGQETMTNNSRAVGLNINQNSGIT